jgi:hypothetical protein
MLPTKDHDFTTMNEQDVREEIVRPLLTRLGYSHGADAYVQTEVPLTYSKAFLGRKNPTKDPELRGRADYVCGVTAAGRWVVEVKAPGELLTEQVVQQAHTYAAHPEVAAFYFLITNGREFCIFETGRLKEPLLQWTSAEQDESFLRISNLLGPDGIRRRSKLVLVDPGQPLGQGLNSKLRISNGSVFYDSIDAGEMSQLFSSLKGLELPVAGGEVARDADGRIHAHVSIASVAPLMRSFGAIGLADHYDFYSSSDYISVDQEQPTIFQHFLDSSVALGTPTFFAGRQTAMPFSMEMTAFTEVVGFVKDDEFQGTMRVEAEMHIEQMNAMMRPFLKSQFGLVPGTHRIAQSGRFRAKLTSAI